MEYYAVVDNKVAAWSCSSASVLILSRFDAYGIVSYVKAGIYHKNVFARVHVQSVTVLRIPRIAYGHIIDDYVAAHKRMDVPAWRVLKKAILQEYVFAILKA